MNTVASQLAVVYIRSLYLLLVRGISDVRSCLFVYRRVPSRLIVTKAALFRSFCLLLLK